MTDFRKLANGYLIAPHRGYPPTPPEGYEAAYGDPYVFLPKLPDCPHRDKKLIPRSCCGGVIERLYCVLTAEYKKRTDCAECKL